MRLKFLALLALLIVLFGLAVGGAEASALGQAGGPVRIYFFWGDGCPHCAAAKPFLAELTERYPGTEVRAYEVWYHPEYQEPLIRMAQKFGFEATAVPTIFVGERYWVGFVEDPIGKEIEAAVAACVAEGCPDAGEGIFEAEPSLATAATPAAAEPAEAAAAAEATIEPATTATAAFTATTQAAAPEPTATLAAPVPAAGPPAAATGAGAQSSVLVLPLLGAVDLRAESLALSTVLIAFVDGFNPCSLWVLSVLLALTLHTGSRKKVFIIGSVFLFVTSLVYALFIAGLFTMFTVINFVGWIQVTVALVALFFGAVNVKDYFWYKEGLSFTIADEQKPGLYRRMRRVLNAGDSLPALVGATVVMSAGASLVEFSCTAGFPLLWTNLLASQKVTALAFIVLLALYMLIYQIDELAIFLAAVFSLRASKLEEKHGRILKLMGGMLMLTLAAVMLINPSLMSSIGASLLVFAIAFAAGGLVLLVHRLILPQMGLHIGSEFAGRRGK